MKWGKTAFMLGLLAWGCSNQDEIPNKEDSTTTKNVIGFSTQVTDSDDSNVTGRSIIDDANEGKTRKLPSEGTLHVFAHEVGKTGFYINDVLPDWWSTTPPFSKFKAPLQGIGASYETTSFLWPNLDPLIFYAYYYKDGGSSLNISQNNITYTLADKVIDQCDLLVSDTMHRSSETVEATGVPMNFRHTMSMVKFAFIKTITTDTEDVRLDSILITDYIDGTIDVTQKVAWGAQQVTANTTTQKKRHYGFIAPIKAQLSTEIVKYNYETASLIFPEPANTSAQKLITIKYRIYRDPADETKGYDTWETSNVLTSGITTAGFEAGKVYLYTLKYIEQKVILEQKPVIKQWNTYSWADNHTNVVDVWGNLGEEVDAYYVLTYSTKNNYTESKVRNATDPFNLTKGGSLTNSNAADKAKYKGKMIIPSSAYTEFNYETTPRVGRIEFIEIPWDQLTTAYSGVDYYKRNLQKNMCPWYRVVKEADGNWYVYGAPYFRYMTVSVNGSTYRSWFYNFKCQYYLYRWCEMDEGKNKNETPTAHRDKKTDGSYSNYTAAEAAAEKLLNPSTQIKEGTPHRSTNERVQAYNADHNKIGRPGSPTYGSFQYEGAHEYYNNGNPLVDSYGWGEYPTIFKIMNGTRTYLQYDAEHRGVALTVDEYRSKFLFVMSDMANDYYNLDVEHIEWYCVNNAGNTDGCHADGIVCSNMSQAEWEAVKDETKN